MISEQDIIKEFKNLPALSTTVVRLLSLISDENTPITEYEKAIKYDPAITAALLKIVNSGFYHRSKDIVSLEQAIKLLGIEQVYQIAVSLGVIPIIPGKMAGYDMDALNYWKHSSAVAIFSEELSAAISCSHSNMAFTAGLLHDIGKLVSSVFLARFKTITNRKLTVTDLSFQEIEKQILGLDHTRVGEVIAKEWNFPQTIINVIKYHHSPNEFQSENITEIHLVKLVHIADSMAHAFGFGEDKGGLKRKIESGVMKDCGLTQSVTEQVVATSLERIVATIEMFNV